MTKSFSETNSPGSRLECPASDTFAAKELGQRMLPNVVYVSQVSATTRRKISSIRAHRLPFNLSASRVKRLLQTGRIEALSIIMTVLILQGGGSDR